MASVPVKTSIGCMEFGRQCPSEQVWCAIVTIVMSRLFFRPMHFILVFHLTFSELFIASRIAQLSCVGLPCEKVGDACWKI